MSERDTSNSSFSDQSMDILDVLMDFFDESSPSMGEIDFYPIVWPSSTNNLISSEFSAVQSIVPTVSGEETEENILFDPNEWLVEDKWSRKFRAPRLYEFLRLLLNNLKYLSYASWTNQSKGFFKVHRPNDVAQLWSRVRNRHSNRTMDYDTFARGIRSYYANGLMVATRTKFTYRFAMDKWSD